MSVGKEDLQYFFCAVCLETQDLRAPALAITVVNGIAVCDEHRRRASFSFDTVVRNARKYLTDGPRSARPSGKR